MAPIKLEDHIREQFEEREITPSAVAWGKLETKLDKNQEKKRPLFMWYAIAASIVGILFISAQFFSSDNTKENQELVQTETEQILKEEKSTSEILKNETQLANKEIAPVIKNEVAPIKEDTTIDKVKNTKTSPKPIIKPQKNVIKTINNTRVAVQEKEGFSIQKISEDIHKDIAVNTKVNEVVAAVEQIKLERNIVTPQEIDALLLNAQRELATQRLLNETKIDATALLNDVEFELEKTFRDKVFDALGDSFSKIRTAVVERNN